MLVPRPEPTDLTLPTLEGQSTRSRRANDRGIFYIFSQMSDPHPAVTISPTCSRATTSRTVAHERQHCGAAIRTQSKTREMLADLDSVFGLTQPRSISDLWLGPWRARCLLKGCGTSVRLPQGHLIKEPGHRRSIQAIAEMKLAANWGGPQGAEGLTIATFEDD